MRNLSETFSDMTKSACYRDTLIVSCFSLVFAGLINYNSTFFLQFFFIFNAINYELYFKLASRCEPSAWKTLTDTNRGLGLDWTNEKNDLRSANFTDN